MPDIQVPAGASHLNLTAGLLVAAGGIMGYAKKKSLPSLIAGSVIGGCYLGSAYAINYSGTTAAASACRARSARSAAPPPSTSVGPEPEPAS